MLLTDSYFDIKRLRIAHEFTLDEIRTCEYPSGRGSYGLVYALSGEAQYRFSTGERVRVGRGDVFLLSADAAYSVSTEVPFRHYTVNFEIHAEDSSLPDGAPIYLLRGKGSDRFEPLFHQTVHLFEKKRTGYRMAAIGLVYELLSLFCVEYANRNGRTTDLRLQSAREYVEQNFGARIDLWTLAHLSNMSVTNFRREWAKRYAETPMQYRDAVRLYYAREYLDTGYYTVSEVAQKCGFEDVSYFIRFFKKHLGISPGGYKKQS